ncbi:3-dehydroquinate synthase [Paremcibacter congregatus]|uniref:3-dehydroquinate synthase n=1 Tax=Paremcibacter congregatus TaxID=2043170 RepID=UPI0030EE074E
MSQKITVTVKDHSYPIYVGANLLEQAGEIIAPILSRPQSVIITDENVARHQLSRLEKSLTNAGIAFSTLILPAGEATKSFDQLQSVLDQLLGLKLERSDKIIALGGGVIGDLVGFAASIYQRGIGFIQIPTTLLSQVDSSVGGKCGINTPRGKNLVGSFHQPDLVLTDVTTLDSLPERQVRAGYAEVVKYGLINDVDFFTWLESNGEKIITGDRLAQTHAILTSCRAKAHVVAEDEKEKGNRALLNLGHTFGHALEAECGYADTLIHGEAVAIGMVMAFDLSVRMGLCPQADAETVRQHLERLALPTRISDPKHALSNIPMTAQRLFDHTLHDKKASGGKVTFVLTRGLGQAFLCRDVAPNDIKAIFQQSLDAAD